MILKPGHLFECIIKNNDPKSVLTWDFDVVTSDLHFTVFRTTKSVSSVNGKIKSSYFSFFVFNQWILLDVSVSVFDMAGLEEDKTYFRVEPTLVCHQKESVQVSNF